MHSNAGWSLLELLVTLLILLILFSIATPALESFVLRARQTADINAFVTAVQLARSEAAKQSRAAVLCATDDWTECAASTVYDGGWMVFVAPDSAEPPRLAIGQSPLFSYRPAMTGSIRSNRSQFVFHPFWRRSTNGTITFCDRRGAASARAVIVSYTGRPRVTDAAAGGPLACAR